MPTFADFREWALDSQANRVYAVSLTPILKRNREISREVRLCTEPMLGHHDTVFDGEHEFVPCVTAIPDIHHAAQGVFAGSSLVSFGAVKITMNPELPIDPATAWDAWEDGIIYDLGWVVRPSAPTGRYYECIVPGESGAVEPDWSFRLGEAVIDGECAWVCKQLTWDVLLDEWVFAGHPVVIKLGGPALAWEDWATVLTGYMGEPSYSDTECTIPVYSPAVKALQAEMPLRTYDPDQWPDRWEAEAFHDRGDIIAATSAGFAKIAVDPEEAIASGYFGWDKWQPEHAFDGDQTIYQIQHGDAENQWNRWMSPVRAGGPSGVDYLGVKKAAAVQVDRVRVFQMAECWMPSALLQYRDTDGEAWTTLCTLTFTVGGNAWEVADLPAGVTSSEHKQWILRANAPGSGTHWSTRTYYQWGLYELEFLTAGETKGYLYICTSTGNSQLSGTSEPGWPTTPGETETEYNGGLPTLTWRCLALPSDAESKPVPVCYGELKNITPVMLDSDAGGEDVTGRIFQFHDPLHGPPQSVDAVYVNGVQKTEDADLSGDDDYLVYLERGIIHFRSSCDMDGPVTMDVHGAEPAGAYPELPGDVAVRWLGDFAGMAEPVIPESYQDYEVGDYLWAPYAAGDPEYPMTGYYYRVIKAGNVGSLYGRPWDREEGAVVVPDYSTITLVCHRRMGGVDQDAIAALNQDLPFPVGVYLDKRGTVKQALDDLFKGLMAWWTVNREGDFTAARFQAPSASSALIPWYRKTLYKVGMIIRPHRNGFYYEVIEGGVSEYYQPAWPEADEAEITEGTTDQVTWRAMEIGGESCPDFGDRDILEFGVSPEERLVNKCTVYGDRNWTPGQGVDEGAVSVERRQWLSQQWRERVAEADPELIRVYPLATTMSHQTYLVKLEHLARMAEGYVQLFGVKREKVKITVAAHGLLVFIGDQVLITWGRYGYADGLYARVVAVRETHGAKPSVEIEAWR